MIFGSLCSGIEAASVAWHPLGWKAAFVSEIEPFQCSVLKHHYPDVPNRGDMTKYKEWPDESIDLLVGGTPCQSFSVAGLRKGLDDPRGNLMFTYLGVLDRYRPRWMVWENVPGVLSSAGGRDFGAFLGGLAQLGYGFAYRILNAQYFGVPQRRRRVFVVGHSGDWRRAAAVLFERQSLSGNPAPSQDTKGNLGDSVAKSLRGRSNAANRPDVDTYIAHPLALCLNASPMRLDPTIETLIQTGGDFDHRITPTLKAATRVGLSQPTGVRRLTVTECERLQGFPDGYTQVPHHGKAARDGPRYKALGNSMAVPVMRWIGERIDMVEAL